MKPAFCSRVAVSAALMWAGVLMTGTATRMFSANPHLGAGVTARG
jgi:hypothetical protein